MFKKLNNKGMTAIEVLVCFSIVSVIVIGMLKSVTNFRDKEETESSKSAALTYKNTITKYIESDIIHNGYVKKVNNLNNKWGNGQYGEITATLVFRDSTEKEIIIFSNNDDNYIIYGDKKFKLPKIEGLAFNKPYIMDMNGEGGTHILKIYVGYNQFDLGNKYDALNIVLPFCDSLPSVEDRC